MIIEKKLIQKMKSMSFCFLPKVTVMYEDNKILETAIQYEMHNNGEYIVKYFNNLAKDYNILCECEHIVEDKKAKGVDLLSEFKKALEEDLALDNAGKTNKINKTN